MWCQVCVCLIIHSFSLSLSTLLALTIPYTYVSFALPFICYISIPSLSILHACLTLFSCTCCLSMLSNTYAIAQAFPPWSNYPFYSLHLHTLLLFTYCLHIYVPVARFSSSLHALHWSCQCSLLMICIWTCQLSLCKVYTHVCIICILPLGNMSFCLISSFMLEMFSMMDIMAFHVHVY